MVESNKTRGWKLSAAFTLCSGIALLVTLATSTAYATATDSEGDEAITVAVFDAHTKAPLKELRIDARRRIGEDLKWAGRAYTDADGLAHFNLDGINEGVPYVFSATPYNGGTVYSDDVAQAGVFEFPVGKLHVTVLAGGTDDLLSNLRIDVREVRTDGSMKWVGRGTTDGNGIVRLDPHGLGTGREFVLEARSPWDGSKKQSHVLREAGETVFVVGNAPLNVHLIDALSQKGLAEQRITAYERLGDDSSRYAGSRTTDEEGFAVFDLTGLGEGREYYLRVTPFNGGTTFSPDLSVAGDYDFLVGTLTVTVVEGGSGEIMPETKIWAYELQPDGAKKYRKHGVTDEEGIIRFDLPRLGNGAEYVLRATSPWDGTTKYSNEISELGETTFTVGNAPLQVRMINYHTKEPVAGLRIWSRERLEGGSSRGISSRTTDDEGRATFDLDGLGEDRTYYLTATPYNGGRISTADLEGAGDFQWKVGSLEVTIVDGAEELPMPGVSVYALERREDGKPVYRSRGTSDEHGIIRFDLDGLGKGSTYVLLAKSPFDGSYKYSDDITEPGRRKFVVGNSPLEVSLLNGISGDPLPHVRVYAYELIGEEQHYRTHRETDSEGFAIFDLDGLGEGRVYVLRTTPYNGGNVTSKPIREGGKFDFYVGTLEVRVVKGSDGSPLANHKVWAYRIDNEEKLTYIASGYSDEEAIIRFDLPGLQEGTPHVLRSRSPIDGSTKQSEPFDEAGKRVFRVGNRGLEVTLLNGISGEKLPGMRIDAYERLPEEERLKWRARAETDDNGLAIFDLEGLGSGHIYVLRARPYNGGDVYSEDLEQAGPFAFRVGTVRVAVTSGATGKPLVDYRVDVRELTEEKTIWRKRGTSDANGIIHFDLPGLDEGRRYKLEAASPIDGSRKYSDEIAEEGLVSFVVGNRPLNITAVNGITGQPLPELQVTVRELLEEGKTRWINRRTTDENGQVSFDIDRLGQEGDDGMFILEARPYNGGNVRTSPIASPGDFRFRFGTVPVTLVDGDNSTVLAGKKVYAYRKLASGKLRYTLSGTTNDLGTVHFDLPGVSRSLVAIEQPAQVELSFSRSMDVVEEDPEPEGPAIYVFKTQGPFGNNKRYYSQFVDQEGPVEFRVTREGEAPLDLTPPEIEITSPAMGSSVDASGFDIEGLAEDNATVTDVTVSVMDAVIGETSIAATYDATTLRWTATVPAGAVSAATFVQIVATARDQALNQSSASITVMPINDTQAPQVAITSHANDDNVGSSGFLLSGTATDDIGVISISATIDDPVVGQTTTVVGVANDGRWTLAVSSSEITEDEQIQVSIVAIDAAGRTGSASLQLNVVEVDFVTRHLVNRITFGATADLLVQVEAIGGATFLNEQLDPAGIDDSALASVLPPGPPSDDDALQASVILRAAYSQRQLLEVMTQFWDNHFNTNLGTHDNVGYEYAENQQFRQNALGRFRDLLDASAKSPAMLIYLDQANSMVSNPNENYPREVMELHTLKVDGPYGQSDVEALARILTGWTVQNGAFFFDSSNHDFGAKTFLGIDFPANQGQAEGDRALDILASHPATANFICEKLAVLFISDTPPGTAVARCAGVFLNEGTNPNQMREVVRSLLTSPEFADPANFRSKVKTPLEHIVGVVRTVGATTDGESLLRAMSDMSMRLFEYPVPTGFSETGDDWTSSDQLLERTKHANRIAPEQCKRHQRVSAKLLPVAGTDNRRRDCAVRNAPALSRRLHRLGRTVRTRCLDRQRDGDVRHRRRRCGNETTPHDGHNPQLPRLPVSVREEGRRS